MNQVQLPLFLAMIVPRMLSQLAERKNISGQEAIRLLYNSKLYEGLEQEETKLWHLSAETLVSLLEEELLSGSISFPEEQ